MGTRSKTSQRIFAGCMLSSFKGHAVTLQAITKHSSFRNRFRANIRRQVRYIVGFSKFDPLAAQYGISGHDVKIKLSQCPIPRILFSG